MQHKKTSLTPELQSLAKELGNSLGHSMVAILDHNTQKLKDEIVELKKQLESLETSESSADSPGFNNHPKCKTCGWFKRRDFGEGGLSDPDRFGLCHLPRLSVVRLNTEYCSSHTDLQPK